MNIQRNEATEYADFVKYDRYKMSYKLRYNAINLIFGTLKRDNLGTDLSYTDIHDFSSKIQYKKVHHETKEKNSHGY